ncbi:hypothetical protein H257_17602 [Aphanomyces astaci]|uniref:Uncharacterized protein n=1 Tax=Aphanomyces astaci TaxID=112090 RepID=W4FE61_APHAT|nr:hypothetical protein H257_17602 [Aphanomyces astaci]ETV65792.1 hypothetical protein H257_17602 [Aphanomyces astaci]|eukprot:XP_009844767.1 hypothetical protein H257_17602 [Aphanomyces astaci]
MSRSLLLLVLAGVASVGTAWTCSPTKIIDWRASCDKLGSDDEKCKNGACHRALHYLVEDIVRDCYVQSGMGDASDLDVYRILDDYCHGETPAPKPVPTTSKPTPTTSTPVPTTSAPSPPTPTTSAPTPTTSAHTPTTSAPTPTTKPPTPTTKAPTPTTSAPTPTTRAPTPTTKAPTPTSPPAVQPTTSPASAPPTQSTNEPPVALPIAPTTSSPDSSVPTSSAPSIVAPSSATPASTFAASTRSPEKSTSTTPTTTGVRVAGPTSVPVKTTYNITNATKTTNVTKTTNATNATLGVELITVPTTQASKTSLPTTLQATTKPVATSSAAQIGALPLVMAFTTLAFVLP